MDCTVRGQESAYLRSNVVGRPAERACRVALKHALSAHAEVSYLNVALAVEQNIIQLQIPSDRGDRSHRYNSF